MGPWMHGGTDGWGWMLGWHLLWWVPLIVLAVAVVVVLTRQGRDRTTRPEPEQILAERYARGEIDTEEYERRRQALR